MWDIIKEYYNEILNNKTNYFRRNLNIWLMLDIEIIYFRTTNLYRVNRNVFTEKLVKKITF